MQVKNPKNEPPYWDDGQRGPNYYHWYRKGKMKKLLRKRWIRKRMQDYESTKNI